MSVYSGFATRQQETFYNKLIEKTLFLMGEKLIFFFALHGNEIGEDHSKFFKHIRKIHKYLANMDRQKYIAPKFSESLEPLSNHIKFNCDSETTSTLTSNFSVFKANGDLNSLAVMNQTSRGSNGDL